MKNDTVGGWGGGGRGGEESRVVKGWGCRTTRMAQRRSGDGGGGFGELGVVILCFENLQSVM